MTDSENKEPSKADIESVVAKFNAMEDKLGALCARTKSLIEAILQDANIRYQSVQFRVKTERKLRQKYLDPAKSYRQLDDITDLAGLRVITYYEDDIDRVAQVIKREFDIDLANSVDKRDTEPDRFGYSALNYVCRHLAKRATDVEYKKFAGIRYEIQVTSVLRHAWSEIEHEWYDLKSAYPKAIKRRFYRIAALLELAESEFQDIRKQRTDYERSVSVRVEARVPDLPVDAVSLKPFIEQEPIVSEIDKSLASILGLDLTAELSDRVVEARAKAVNAVGIRKLQQLRDTLREHSVAVPEFVRRCREELWPAPPSSSTSVGQCIYHLAVFLLSAKGREQILEFLKERGAKPTWDIDRQVAIAQEIAAK